MSEITIKLPDIGEGIAEAEISDWSVEVGAWVNEDDVLCAVMTDKATVEIPSSSAGKVLWRAGEPGDMLAIGAPLVRIEGEAGVEATPVEPSEPEPQHVVEPQTAPKRSGTTAKMLAAPAVRHRVRDLGVDLASVSGSGPDGRVTHADLDRLLGSDAPSTPVEGGIEEIKIIGLRRKIAEQMARANASVPQITIVEEVDVTELETLRTTMNGERTDIQPKLTLLPFLIRAMTRARAAAPQINARYDDETEVLYRHDSMHVGIATQTDDGLMVPVLSDAGNRSVWQIAEEITRLSSAARDGSLAREELTGSTITVTSLGPLGAVATTPIVNAPEVAIVGVNRMQTRPLWDGTTFRPRKVMNISASFDHRIVDGWDAAQFIARLKTLLETPALIFV